MALKVRCPTCQELFSTRPEMAGAEITCPMCQARFELPAAEMAVSVTYEQFLSYLADSGVMLADDVNAVVSGLPEDRRPQDGEQLARELVRANKLTVYQAQQLYAGKGKELVRGNYVILDRLGKGGMGVVYKAEHKRMHRLAALKVLSPQATKSPEAVKRFHREFEAAGKLNHPNLVAAYDAGKHNGTHFLVMEYVEGDDLSSLVKRDGPLPIDTGVNYILQAARGLEFAHQRGVIHRDIKPANMLLDAAGNVKILDMGLARFDTDAAHAAELTGTGQVMGTVDYMAPEQALSTKQADQRSDIYSLGMSLWYLLTGQAAYGGDSLMARMLAHREQPIPSLCAARNEAPQQLDAAFAKMIAKNAKDRYQSMSEVIAVLETCRPGCAERTEVPVARRAAGKKVASAKSVERPPQVAVTPATSTRPELPGGMSPDVEQVGVASAVTFPRRSVLGDDMDMTPMVDVTFLLLIFFMVTAAFSLQKSYQVPTPDDSRPSTQTTSLAELEDDPRYVIVRIDQYDTFHVSAAAWEEEQEVPSKPDLLDKLRTARSSTQAATHMLVMASEKARHQQVIAALDAGTAVGMEDVKLLTTPTEE